MTSAAWIASAAEPTASPQPGKRSKQTRAEAPPPERGPDGWYDARPPDNAFRIRMPAVFQAFSEDDTTEKGDATRTNGVRASAVGAFGGNTSYVASCIDRAHDKRSAQERLRSVVDHWAELGLMNYRKPLELAGHPGFEFEMKDDVKLIRVHIYATRTGTCTVLLSWRPFAKPSDADLAKYFDSFQLTKP